MIRTCKGGFDHRTMSPVRHRQYHPRRLSPSHRSARLPPPQPSPPHHPRYVALKIDPGSSLYKLSTAYLPSLIQLGLLALTPLLSQTMAGDGSFARAHTHDTFTHTHPHIRAVRGSKKRGGSATRGAQPVWTQRLGDGGGGGGGGGCAPPTSGDDLPRSTQWRVDSSPFHHHHHHRCRRHSTTTATTATTATPRLHSYFGFQLANILITVSVGSFGEWIQRAIWDGDAEGEQGSGDQEAVILLTLTTSPPGLAQALSERFPLVGAYFLEFIIIKTLVGSMSLAGL